MTTHSNTVLANFELKAKEYDDFMTKCIPEYFEFIENLIHVLPEKSSGPIKICDLGSGTGNVTRQLLAKYPDAEITCVDISPMMTDLAKAKLNSSNVNYEISDFYNYQFTEKFDIIVSSLALHHLVTDEDKKKFYQQIFEALKTDGVFYNADVVIAASEEVENKNMENWKQWLRKYHTEEDLMEMVINRYYEEDRPTTTTNHTNWLEEIGFKNVDIIWRISKGAVWGGMKK